MARRAPTQLQLLTLTGFALLAAGLVLLASRDGMTTTADSAVYVGTARSVAAGHGLDVPIHYYPLGNVNIGTPAPGQFVPSPTPLVIYAPLAPILLAIGDHPVGAARVEDAFFFAVTVLLVGLIVLWRTRERWLAMASQAVVAFSLASIVADVGTLAAALAFSAVALVAVLAYADRPSRVWLFVAALMIGLATLERFAAGGLIVWGAIALRHRWRDAVSLLVLSSIPVGGWFSYENLSGRSTGHFLGFHIEASTVRSGIESISDWILPTNTPLPVALLATIALAVLVLLLVRRPRAHATRLLVLFAIVQLVVLEVAITFVDAGVDLDRYELIPVFLAVVIAVACSIDRTALMRFVTAAAVVGCVLRFGVDTISDPTAGYATPAWSHSPIMAAVRDLPARSIIYTNAPDAIYLLDHRATSSVPETTDFSTLKTNPQFGAQLQEIRRTLSTRGGYVVFVRGLGRGAFLPTEAELRSRLSLQLVRNVADGAIYSIRGIPYGDGKPNRSLVAL